MDIFKQNKVHTCLITVEKTGFTNIQNNFMASTLL